MTDLLKGADEAGETDDSSVCEELRHLGDAPDVLLAVLLREVEVLVEAVSDVVAVEAVGRDAVSHKVLLQGERDRRLARPRQACEQHSIQRWAAAEGARGHMPLPHFEATNNYKTN